MEQDIRKNGDYQPRIFVSVYSKELNLYLTDLDPIRFGFTDDGFESIKAIKQQMIKFIEQCKLNNRIVDKLCITCGCKIISDNLPDHVTPERLKKIIENNEDVIQAVYASVHDKSSIIREMYVADSTHSVNDQGDMVENVNLNSTTDTLLKEVINSGRFDLFKEVETLLSS
jgi:hypothetical protein